MYVLICVEKEPIFMLGVIKRFEEILNFAQKLSGAHIVLPTLIPSHKRDFGGSRKRRFEIASRKIRIRAKLFEPVDSYHKR